MLLKIFLSILIIFIPINTSYSNSNVYIVAKIDNEIITNRDIIKESEYLKILNPSLSQLENVKITKLAKKSLIKEIIKKKEISKFIDLKKDNMFVGDYLKNLFSKLNYKDINEFEKELKIKKNYTIEQIKEKIKIELFWNELIYQKYFQLVKINKEKLIKRVENLTNKNQKEFLLSEIIFKKKKDIPLKILIKEINLSIKEVGFNNTANIYSNSESSKIGGKLGWVNENSLSNLILENINNLNEGDYSKAFNIGNNYMILKVDQIKLNKVVIDKEKELNKLIRFETNKQLNQFSRVYFEKSKMNYSLYEN